MFDMTIGVTLPTRAEALAFYRQSGNLENKFVRLTLVSWFDQDVCVVVDCKAKRPSLRRLKKHLGRTKQALRRSGVEIMGEAPDPSYMYKILN